ncbi:DUF4145 domain-containing protein [Pandoraea capi]|uniref:DUF4145 domain-containing protein n=1 Tax=Pandoraea TaxID=93217 RepID=UPI001F5C6F7B|nr:DUF4145 domain-containing protein [Pandoraea capi]
MKLLEEWDSSGMPEPALTHYPARVIRKEPSWMFRWWMSSADGDKPAMTICREVYRALQNDQPHLAAMGVRSVLELVMIDKIGGDLNRFDANLNALFEKGHVSMLMRDRLKKVLDAGSATIHRGHTPSADDLETLVDVMEHIVESLYVHEYGVQKLTERIPPRPAILKPAGKSDDSASAVET